MSTFIVVPKPPKPALTGNDGLYRSVSAKTPREPYLSQLKASFTFLRGQKLISNMVAMLFITNMFSQVGTVTFIPLWINANQNQSPIALGWIGGAFALGGVSGNAVFTALATKLPRYKTFVAGYFIGGAPRFLVLAFSHNLLVVAAVWACSGFALASTNPTIGAVMYRQVPANMLARVGSLASAISFAGIAAGGLVGGFSVENIGFAHAVILASVVYFAATLLPVIGHRTWRLIDVVTRPARVSAARVAVRLVLSQHRWVASVVGRGGATVLEDHPLDASVASLALGLINPPELHTGVQAMLAQEHAHLSARTAELRASLAAAEERLRRLTVAAEPMVNGNGHAGPLPKTTTFPQDPNLVRRPT